jgi:hypothetical protein
MGVSQWHTRFLDQLCLTIPSHSAEMLEEPKGYLNGRLKYAIDYA